MAERTADVQAHWTRPGVLARIDAALAELGQDPQILTPDILATVEHLHSGGLATTREQAKRVALTKDSRVLDVGCGIGGPARYLERFPAELNRGFPIVCERASLAALIRGSGGTKSMPKPYSDDLRERVIEAVVAGASRREAAESFSLSASSAVRWLQRWRDTGNARAKLSGGSTSPLEEHVEWLLALVAEQPDLTLDEIVAAMRKQRIPGSRTAVWRFFERHNVTVKKKPARDGARTGGRGAGAAALDSQARPA